MWNIILSILSVIGNILLILTILILVILLIVLFYPITYRIKGKKMPEETWLLARANWLFGLIRIRYGFPEPGSVVVKLLWKTVFDSGAPKDLTAQKKKAAKKTDESDTEQDEVKEEKGNIKAESGNIQEKISETVTEEINQENTEGSESGISSKISKLKYTIQKIYDKIKEIWDNLSYYAELIRERETLELWQHAKLCLGKIFRNIRPRRIRANILFGTGSPDTTGYVMGIYSVLSPRLGSKVIMTPDFTQSILQGEADISGHITVFVLTVNSLRVLFDKKLNLFLKKLKRRKKDGR